MGCQVSGYPGQGSDWDVLQLDEVYQAPSRQAHLPALTLAWQRKENTLSRRHTGGQTIFLRLPSLCNR